MGLHTPSLWLVPALPLAGFLFNVVFGRFLPKRGPAVVACLAVGAAAAVSVGLVSLLADRSVRLLTADAGAWIQAGDFSARMALSLDPLSAVMICLVTGVGFLIHLCSAGYMAHDKCQPRYFAWLNLFVAMMLILVLADNLALCFLGWEGVGLCSYLLIGFWHEDPANAAAGLKAFLTNRVGDAGFVLGMLALWAATGTLAFSGINAAAHGHALTGLALLAGTFGLLVGVAGKSAQVPLYVWLPDAMAGPTPVSALIHAATMVTAGVYLLCRLSAVFLICPAAMSAVSAVGAATLLVGALYACRQTDIKKVLAYSTISQLGYLVLACGSGAFGAAMFHLLTHAFFKACLFLGAGSVIHALGGVQDLRKMGGLRSALPWTHATFAVSVAAICGVPPFSGFFSKEAILGGVLEAGHPALWAVGLVGAALTAFYMTRLYLLAFWSTDRLDAHAREHLHESPPVMTLPLVVLALLAAVGGLIGAPLGHWLAFPEPLHGPVPLVDEHFAMVSAIVAAGTGIGVAWRRYVSAAPVENGPCRTLDVAYEALVLGPIRRGAEALWFWMDRVLIDGLMVEAPALLVRGLGAAARRAQGGFVGASVAFLLAGVLLLLWLLHVPGLP